MTRVSLFRMLRVHESATYVGPIGRIELDGFRAVQGRFVAVPLQFFNYAAATVADRYCVYDSTVRTTGDVLF